MQSLLEAREMTKSLEQAIITGCQALITAQQQCGSWEDYQLPVGTSNEWVSAYVGLALAEAWKMTGNDELIVASQKALDWLSTRRRIQGGIGYNGDVEADADSTAHLILLAQQLGCEPAIEDLQFLAGHQRMDGGFTTYGQRNDAWGQSHPCVTGVVARALKLASFPFDHAGVQCYLASLRRSDGLWPSYWWLEPAYATYFNLLYLSVTTVDIEAGFRVERSCVLAPNNVMDLALCLGLMNWMKTDEAVYQKWLEVLLSLQGNNGLWPSSRTLRVTDWNCYKPWEQPKGTLYDDQQHLMTTATVVRILTLPIGGG